MSGGRRAALWLASLVMIGAGVTVIRAGSSSDDVPEVAATVGTAPTTTTSFTTTTTSVTTTTQPVERLTLREAIDTGVVETEFTATGGASGDVIELAIRRLGDTVLELSVESGVLLTNPSGPEQDMVVAGLEGVLTGANTYQPTEVIRLDDDEWVDYLLEAYCAEAHDDNPSEGGVLTLGDTNADLAAVLDAAMDTDAAGDLMVIQAVVWVVTDDVSVNDLQSVGYGLEEEQVALARQVIEAAGLDPASYRLFG